MPMPSWSGGFLFAGFMSTFPSSDTIEALQSLIARATGSRLDGAAQAEMLSLLQGAGQDAEETRNLVDAAGPREMTLLVAGLRGLPDLLASQPHSKAVSVINRCLVRLGEVALRHGGTIDHFMHDSLMVLFGIPAAREDDVERALLCAIEMQVVMRDLNQLHLDEHLLPMFLGVGVHSGMIVAGHLGLPLWSGFTVMGEDVDLATGIQAFSLRGQVLISDAVYQRCWGMASASAPMQVYIKGRSRPESLHELIAVPSRRLKVPRQEFRRSHRVNVRIPCQCQHVQDGIVTPNVVASVVRDLGYHGLLLVTDEPLPLHAEVRLEFDLALVDYRASDVYARVVNVKQDGAEWMAGIEFTTISPECSAKVQMFVQLLVGKR
jgi:adenylate cyclase